MRKINEKIFLKFVFTTSNKINIDKNKQNQQTCH